MLKSFTRRGSRGELGSRRIGFGVLGVVLIALGTFGIIEEVAGASNSSANTYGGLPSWLPKSTIPVGQVLQAFPGHPVLGIEGDTAHVELGSGGADIVAVGPQVPESGDFPVPKTSPVTFSITIDDVHGDVPLKAGDFVILDELGHSHHPNVTIANGSALPVEIATGHKLELEVQDDQIPTGSGDLQWRPMRGGPLVSWDFDVEID